MHRDFYRARLTTSYNVLVSFLFVAAFAGNTLRSAEPRAPESPDRVALQFIDALLFQRDVDKTIDYFHKDAERKTSGPGSAIREARAEVPRLNELQIRLRRVVFFREDEILAINQEYPKFSFVRVADRIGDGVGCMLVGESMKGDSKQRFHFVFVLKEFDGKYKITFQDDD